METDERRARTAVVMVGTRPDSRGGIASVVRLYETGRLFQIWPIVYVPTHAEGSPALKVVLVLKALARILWRCMNGRLLGLHVHLATRASFWRKALVIASVTCFRRPIVLHLHSGRFVDYYDRQLGAIGRGVARWMFTRSARVIVLSPEWQRWVTATFVGARTSVVGNPVLVPRSVAARRDSWSVLFLGRLEKEKGIYDLLEALAALRVRIPGVKLLCAGEGDFAGVSRRVEDRSLQGCVDMLGWVEGEEKRSLIDRAAVFVLPSYKEGVPMSILEAMAHGLPVVATSVGGVPDIVQTEVDGLLVRPGDVAGLTAALERMLSDESLRRTLAQRARSRVIREASVEKVVEQLGTVYADMGVRPCLNEGK